MDIIIRDNSDGVYQIRYFPETSGDIKELIDGKNAGNYEGYWLVPPPEFNNLVYPDARNNISFIKASEDETKIQKRFEKPWLGFKIQLKDSKIEDKF